MCDFHVKTVGARFAPFYTILRHFTPFYAMWRQKNLWERFIWVYATFCWVYEPFSIKKTVKIVRFSCKNCGCSFCAILRHFTPFYAMWRQKNLWERFIWMYATFCWVYEPFPIKKTVKIVRFSWVNCRWRFCAILRHFAPFCATNTTWITFFLSKMCSYSIYRPYWV